MADKARKKRQNSPELRRVKLERAVQKQEIRRHKPQPPPQQKKESEKHKLQLAPQTASLPQPEKSEHQALDRLKLPVVQLERRQILIAIAALLIIVSLLFALLPSFRIHEFSSTPLRLVSEQQLLEASGLRPGQHFLKGLIQKNFARSLRGRYSEAEEAILEKIPQIRDVEVRLQSPQRIFFRVLERLPIAALQIPDGVILMDRDGLAVQLRATVPPGVPLISGLNVTRVAVGEKVEIDLPRDLQRALGILSALVEADAQASKELQLMPLLQEVRPGANQRVLIKLRLPANGKILNLSCAQNDYLTKHFVWLRSVIATGVFDERVPGTLDLSGRYQIFKPLDPERETEVYQWDQGVPIEPVAPPIEESVWEDAEYLPEEGAEDFATP